MPEAKSTSRAARRQAGTSAGRATPWLTRLAGVALVVSLALLGFDAWRAQHRALAAGDAELRRTARIADALWEADASRIQALLARLRVELRSQTRWAGPVQDASGSAAAAPTRRTDMLLRRALEGAPEIGALELVVADQGGLSRVRIEPGAGPPEEAADAKAGAARARTLWYSEPAAEAIAANGRKVVRGPLEIVREGDAGQAIVQAFIALHDADDVVQGLLVAEIDLWPLGSRLASLSSEAVRCAVMAADGQLIGDGVQSAGDARAPGRDVPGSLDASDGMGDAIEAAIVERDGVRRLVQPIGRGAGDAKAGLAFRIETDAPPTVAAVLLAGPGVALLAALVLFAGSAWMRGRAGVVLAGAETDAAAMGATRSVSSMRAQAHSDAGDDVGTARPAVGRDAEASGSEPERVRSERFVLREWLADVRGCLEREAASRGLSLVLRCERGLPREVEQDPNWLGGLLVSLGREALDATSGSRVALEVRRGEGAALRFELEAAGALLDPVEGMRVIAHRLGASLESPRPGCVAVVVPHALA